MQERHNDKKRYFAEQERTTKKYVIPYLTGLLKIGPGIKVLEIGCAEAGNLKPFLDLGCKATGVDISCGRVELAREFFADHPQKQNLQLFCSDIYQTDLDGKKFDIIVMRDVIEHIPNQEKFLVYVKKFLKPNGKLFLGFPPWQNPFGGHQQVCQNKFLSKLPYFHLLPKPVYRQVLKTFEKNEARVESLMEIKETGISIERLERILKKENYSIDKRTFFLINPNYETKFGLKPRRQIHLISAIPWVRNFFTTAAYYVVSK
ncbi:Methyltransferase domain-containing protein [Mariniphaga anaerophila]|uniref:Methyltransferase domain-containing protein n=1 Tax=Mariniphaga anaerophila TaxID=1484053 RepID=A0A1M5EJJ8_9BACT|nr:class I SAM-dependent methyltransferase [Mariniphaga anaerophila]SHF79419.1 Methyltransferase domain-containing protein [Mariniphaga anaerophila]